MIAKYIISFYLFVRAVRVELTNNSPHPKCGRFAKLRTPADVPHFKGPEGLGATITTIKPKE